MSATELQKLVVRLQADMSQYKKELDKVGLMTTRTATQMELALRSVSKQAKVLAGHLKDVGTKLTTWVTTPLVAFAGYGVKSFADFDLAMTESLSIMDVTAAQTEKMRDLALELATKGTKGPAELAKSYYFLASAGLSAEQAMGALPTIMRFATAGAFDMETATSLLADAQTSMGIEMDKSGKNMERLANAIVRTEILTNASSQQFSEALTNDAGVAARNFGMELQTTMAILGAYASSGTKGAEAGSQMGRALRLLQQAARDNGAAFKKHGIDVIDDATGEYRNFIDIVKDLEKAFAGMTKPEISAALVDLGFETLAQKAILPLLGMSDQMKRWEADIASATGEMDKVYAKQMQAFSNQIKMMWNQVKVAAIEIGASLVPMLKKLSEQLQAGLAWWKGLSQESKEWYVKLGMVVAALGPASLALSKLASIISVMTSSMALAKAGLVGLAIGGIAILSKAIYDHMPAIKELNAELQKGADLNAKFVERSQKDWADWEASLAELKPEDQMKALQEKLGQVNNDSAGTAVMTQDMQGEIDRMLGKGNRVKDNGIDAPLGMLRNWVHKTVGNKEVQGLEDKVAENQKKMKGFTEKRVELERRIQELKDTQLMADKKAAELQAAKLAEAPAYIKKMADGWFDFRWKAGLAMDKVEDKGRGLFRVFKKKAKEVWENASIGDPKFRINQAVRGDTMEGMQAQAATAKFVAENTEKKKSDEDRKKQTDLLEKIATNTKRAVIPYSGLLSFAQTFVKS